MKKGRLMLKKAFPVIGTIALFLFIALLITTPALAAAPVFSSASVASDNTYIKVTFDQGVYGAGDGTTAVSAASFALTFTQGSGNATNAVIADVFKDSGLTTHPTGGETDIYIKLTVTGTPNGNETIKIAPASDTSIYNVGFEATPATSSITKKWPTRPRPHAQRLPVH